jgi:hypothetical protein
MLSFGDGITSLELTLVHIKLSLLVYNDGNGWQCIDISWYYNLDVFAASCGCRVTHVPLPSHHVTVYVYAMWFGSQ